MIHGRRFCNNFLYQRDGLGIQNKIELLYIHKIINKNSDVNN